MIARVLIAFALAHAASAARFYNPSANLEKSAPGGVFQQDNTAQGVAFAYNFGERYSNDARGNLDYLGHCPDIQFFGNVSISYMSHSGQCLVEYSAIMWQNMQPTIVHNERVFGQASFSKGFRSQGALQYWTPCYILVNNIEFEVYATYDAPPISGVSRFRRDHEDYLDKKLDGPFINFIDHSKGCRQHALSEMNPEDAGLSVENPATVEASFAWKAGVTPVGPMTVTQKSNGNRLVTSAYIIGQNAIEKMMMGKQPNIFDGTNPAEYNKYNLGLVVTEGTYVVRANVTAQDSIHGISGVYDVMYLETFKKRDAWIFLANDLKLDLIEDNIAPQQLYFETHTDGFGRKKLTVLTTFTDYQNTAYLTYYSYSLVRKNAAKFPFKKNQINEWFGGEKQKYEVEEKENPAARTKPERKRKKHRRKKRRTGKKSDNRDNRRFKLKEEII
jgi:hypothetical protein